MELHCRAGSTARQKCPEAASCARRIELGAVSISLALGVMKGLVGLFGLSEALVADGLFSLQQSFVCGKALVAGSEKRPRRGAAAGDEGSAGFVTLVAGFIFLFGIINVMFNSILRLVATTGGLAVAPGAPTAVAAAVSIAGNWLLHKYGTCVSTKTKGKAVQDIRPLFRRSMAVSGIALVSIVLSQFVWTGLDELAAILLAALLAKPTVELFVKAGAELRWTKPDAGPRTGS